MGNSSSSSSSSDLLPLPLLNHNDDHRSTLVSDQKTTTRYNWNIKGFSSLLKLQDKDGFLSGSFTSGGCRWMLHMKLMTAEIGHGKCYISVSLGIKGMPSYAGVKAKYNLSIYNQNQNKQIRKTGTAYFTSVQLSGQYHYMVPLETFQSPASGFLINDSCIISVEIINVLHTSACKAVSECLSVCKGSKTHVLHTWKIKGCTNSQRPDSCSSEAFVVGGLKWYVVMHPFFEDKDKYISIWLKLDEWDARHLESGVCVEFSVCIKNLVDGKHKKLTRQGVFSLIDDQWGWMKFLSYEDFNDLSKGFLVDDNCIVEVSVAVLGSVSCNI